jgi:hypothetical protein
LKLIQKAKEKFGGVFLGWHWRGKVLLFGLGHLFFQRSCSLGEVGLDFSFQKGIGELFMVDIIKVKNQLICL